MTGVLGEGASTRPRSAVRALTTVAVIAALVAVCAVAWSLMGHRVPDPEDRTVPPVGLDGRYARDSLVLVAYGSGRENYGSVRTFDQVVDMKFLGEREIAVFRSHGARAARAAVASTLPEGKIVGVAVRMSDRGAAVTAADELNAMWVGAGFAQTPDRPWVRRSELTGRERPIARAVYAHGDLLVRVELTGKSEAALSADFTRLLTPQLDLLPADG
ncbi:hypothetical protein [Actinokineospora fastidiosa]|uniref:Uncharacterized protein n=1 Tax=Actinokineospora fastidiosa TaxID=1816 RepID=A0A918G443_9PSEU|nr:hypothetical protein [Actinokineospora fastidiosa]GGS18570.1 hypothetical protein GCM10010171_08880 [Actinokineospora fastidiosa]